MTPHLYVFVRLSVQANSTCLQLEPACMHACMQVLQCACMHACMRTADNVAMQQQRVQTVVKAKQAKGQVLAGERGRRWYQGGVLCVCHGGFCRPLNPLPSMRQVVQGASRVCLLMASSGNVNPRLALTIVSAAISSE
jgi:hypothetical protein